MASFTFQLVTPQSTLDLSQYVRVAPGEGLDPYQGSRFRNPFFTDSPFTERQPITSVKVSNREMVFPLAAHGAGNTKAQLHALIAQINQQLGAPGLQVVWQDAGAPNPTYYDVVFARFEPDFNFRRSEQGWGFGSLHLWVGGYGSTGTSRLVASGAGSGVLLTLPVPSIGGDAPALADWRLYCGSAVPGIGRAVVVSAIGPTQYTPEVPAGSLIAGPNTNATLIGASGAAGSQFLAVGTAVVPSLAAIGLGGLVATTLAGYGATYAPLFQVALSPASAYIGANRVLAIARSRLQSGLALRAIDADGVPLGPTAIASAQDWQLVDLGVARVPTVGALPATLLLSIVGGGLGPTGALGLSQAIGGSQPPYQINEVVVLPDQQTALVVDDPRTPVGFDSFDQASSLITNLSDSLGNAWGAPVGQGGAMGSIGAAFGANCGVFVYNGRANGTTGLGGAKLQTPLLADLAMRADVVFATQGQPSVFFSLRKEIASSAFVDGRLVALAVGSGFMDILSGGSLVACQAVAPSAASYQLTLVTAGPKVTLTARPADIAATGMVAAGAAVPVASLSASIGLAAAQGQPAFLVAAASGVPTAGVFDFAVAAMPSLPLAAQDMYELNGQMVPDDCYQASGGAFGSNAGVETRRLTGRLHGRVPQLSPSTSKVVVLEVGLDSGPANDILQVELRAQERFTYAV